MFIPIYNLVGFQNPKDLPKIAKVINNADPKGLGRIKVSLNGIFDPADDSGTNLPWIRRMSSDMGIGTEEMNVPPVGSNVEIIWPYDNKHAFYRGVPFGDSSLIGSFDGYDWGWATSSGFALMVQKSTGNFIIKTNATNIVGDSDGNISITVNKDLTNAASENITNTASQSISNNASGNISNTANGNISSTGAAVSITASGAVTISGGSVIIGENTTIDGIAFLSHTHSNGNQGNPTGGVIT